MHKMLYAVFDPRKGILKQSSKKGKILNFLAGQPFNARKRLLVAEREVSPGKDYWRRIHV